MAMAKKEKTVEEKLKELYELQQIDSELDQIEILKGELPIEVSDLEDEIEGLQTRIGKVQSQIAEIEADIAKNKTMAKESEANVLRYEKQLDDVKNNREFESLTKQIENQKLDIQLAEKRMKDAKVLLTTKQESLAEIEVKLDNKKKMLDTKKVELEKIIEKTEKDEEKLNKKSTKAREKIESRLLAAYDKIRGTYRNGLAVVTVQRDACGGCYNFIPPQVKLEISLNNKIIACEHCGRVLVDEFILENNPS
jgi:uncharacterized protein